VMGEGGTLTYGGDILFEFSFTPDPNDTFTIFTGFASNPTGTFSNINFANTGFDGSFDYLSGTLTIEAIPEPSTALMLILAGVIGLLRRRYRQGIVGASTVRTPS